MRFEDHYDYDGDIFAYSQKNRLTKKSTRLFLLKEYKPSPNCKIIKLLTFYNKYPSLVLFLLNLVVEWRLPSRFAAKVTLVHGRALRLRKSRSRSRSRPSDKNDYEYFLEYFSILSIAHAWTSVILAGKRDSGRHSTTSFSENVVVVETSYQMSEVLSFCYLGRALVPLFERCPLNIISTASVSAKKISVLKVTRQFCRDMCWAPWNEYGSWRFQIHKVEITSFFFNNFLCGKGNLCAHRVKHGQVFNLLVVMFSLH